LGAPPEGLYALLPPPTHLPSPPPSCTWNVQRRYARQEDVKSSSTGLKMAGPRGCQQYLSGSCRCGGTGGPVPSVLHSPLESSAHARHRLAGVVRTQIWLRYLSSIPKSFSHLPFRAAPAQASSALPRPFHSRMVCHLSRETQTWRARRPSERAFSVWSCLCLPGGCPKNALVL